MMTEATGNEAGMSYVLITPARNEEAFIAQTIRSVIAQTIRPVRWVIVNDGSVDATNAIVEHYAAQYNWIDLVSLPGREKRNFAGKVYAFNAGYERLKDVSYGVIGNLDADLTFGPDYFEFLMRRFVENPKLGVAGTPFREGEAMYDYRFTNIEHVSGACQLFRRECFEAIGGYVPIKEGGVDLVAVITARMRGWQTRTFPDRIMEHHRCTQSGGRGGLKATFRSGYHDYLMGNPMAWQIARSLYQMTKRPYGIGGGVLFVGYVWAILRRPERPVSREWVKFRQQEQKQRLKQFFALKV